VPPVDLAGLDVVVVASRHRPALVVPHLAGRRHRVCYTPDYPMPAVARSNPLTLATYVVNPVGAYRCYRGHQDALSAPAHDRVLVLEDDAVPNRADWIDVARRAAGLLERFEVVSLHGRDPRALDQAVAREGLGFHTLRPVVRRRLFRSVRMRWCQGTLAYLITRAAAARLVARPWDGLPIDHCLANEFAFCVIDRSPFDHDRRHGSLVERPR
jgi:hypothetical protein